MKNFYVISICLFHMFISSFCFDFQIGNQGRKHAALDRFDGTCGERHLPIVVHLHSIRPEGKNIHVSATVTVKEQGLPTDPVILIKVQRCKSKENLDSCQGFHEYKMSNLCETISSDIFIWKSLFDPFEPKFTCPIKKGVYRSNDSMVDPTMFIVMFPQESWFWKGRLEARDQETNRLFMCVYGEARVTLL